MDKEEIFKYWKDTSDKDYITMNNLFASKDYSWSLFIGHLVIEKLLKAVYKKTQKISIHQEYMICLNLLKGQI